MSSFSLFLLWFHAFAFSLDFYSFPFQVKIILIRIIIILLLSYVVFLFLSYFYSYYFLINSLFSLDCFKIEVSTEERKSLCRQNQKYMIVHILVNSLYLQEKLSQNKRRAFFSFEGSIYSSQKFIIFFYFFNLVQKF